MAIANACAFAMLSLILIWATHSLYKTFNDYQSKNKTLMKEFSQLIKNFGVFTVAYTSRSAFDIIYVTVMSETDASFLAGQLLFLLWEILPILLMYSFHYNSSRKLQNWAEKQRVFSCHSSSSPKQEIMGMIHSTSIDFEYSVFPGS